MRGHQRVYRLGAVGRLLSPTAAGAMPDLPLSKRGERAILAANRPESGECRVNNLKLIYPCVIYFTGHANNDR
jgi:hypothetical protein